MPEASMDRDRLLNSVREKNIKFIKLLFIDIDGMVKSVEIPSRNFLDALKGKKMFSYQGREESDMFLSPDADTFSILPWTESGGNTAIIICNIITPEGETFSECSRTVLRKNAENFNNHGFDIKIGAESEFFIFPVDERGNPMVEFHDKGTYMEWDSMDKGEKIRREIIEAMEFMGLDFENSHHEMSPGQHEINFSPSGPLRTADNFMIFRTIVKIVARRNNCHATFMPRPDMRRRGSGLHIHQSLYKDGKNIFHDPSGKYGLSEICLNYMGGLMHYARQYTAVTNPLVNSYKRIVLYNAAPVYVTWAEKNRMAMIRVLPMRDENTRFELRSPDPACNPYLALSVILKAGLTGIENKIEPPSPCNGNIFNLSQEYINDMKIQTLPATLFEALQEMSGSLMVISALGGELFQAFIRKKFDEWNKYNEWIHPWELDSYLERY